MDPLRGGAYIETDYAPSCTDRIETRIRLSQFTANVNACVYCSRPTGTTPNVVCFALSNDRQFRFDRNSTATYVYSTKGGLNASHEYALVQDLKTGACFVNGDKVGTHPVSAFTAQRGLTIFCSCLGDGHDNFGYLRLYVFKITDGDGRVRVNMVPCARRSDGAVGLYDTVRGRFFGNANTAAGSAFVKPVAAKCLPAGYRPLDWIKGDGQAWINTGYKPEGSDRVEMKVRLGSFSINECLFCTRTGGTSSTFTCFGQKDAKTLRFDYNTGNTVARSDLVNLDDDFEIVEDGHSYEAFVNGEKVATIGSSSFVPVGPFTLFAAHTAGANPTDNVMANRSSYRLYYFRVLDYRGCEKLWLVPALRMSDSKAGLYDLVGQRFLSNASASGAFTAGSGDARFWVGEGDGVSWGDAANWYPSGTPSSTQTVVINGATTISNTTGVIVSGLTVQGTNGVTLAGSGSLTVGSDGVVNEAGGPLILEQPIALEADGLQVGPAGMVARRGLSFTTDVTLRGLGGFELGHVPLTVAGTFDVTGENGPVVWGAVGSQAGLMRVRGGQTVVFAATNAFTGAVEWGTNAVGTAGFFDLNGFSQTGFTAFSTEGVGEQVPTITSASPAQIVLSGGSQGSPVVRARFLGKAGLCWNPSDSSGVLTVDGGVQGTAGELVVSNGIVRLAAGATFTNLTRVVVASGAELEVSAGAGTSFRAVTLEVADDAVVRLGADVCLAFRQIGVTHAGAATTWLDGEHPYSADGHGGTTAQTWIRGEGTVEVDASSGEIQNVVWDAGGGADASLFAAANWENDVLPLLRTGEAWATFPCGDRAVADGLTRFYGITVTDGAGDFTFVRSGSNEFSLFGGGLSMESATVARTVTIEPDVTLKASQTWTVAGTNNVLALGGSVRGASTADLELMGAGAVRIGGDLDAAGKLKVSLTNLGQGGLTLTDDCVVKMPVDFSMGSSEAGLFASNVTFRESVTMRSPMTAQITGRMTLEGGFVGNACTFTAEGPGTYVVTNAPISGSTFWYSTKRDTQTHLWTADNFAGFYIYGGARLHCHVPFALNGRANLRLGYDAYDTYSADGRGWMEMEGDQTVKEFPTGISPFGLGGPEVHASDASVLQYSNATDRACYAVFRGGASLRQTGTNVTDLCCASDSTGTVEVVAGMLTFREAHTVTVGGREVPCAGGSWTRATRMTVGGGSCPAVADFRHRGVLGRTTVLDVRANGRIRIADGVRVKVGRLCVDGVPASAGTFGAPGSGAQHVDALHFDGTGVVACGDCGMVVVVR